MPASTSVVFRISVILFAHLVLGCFSLSSPSHQDGTNATLHQRKQDQQWYGDNRRCGMFHRQNKEVLAKLKPTKKEMMKAKNVKTTSRKRWVEGTRSSMKENSNPATSCFRDLRPMTPSFGPHNLLRGIDIHDLWPVIYPEVTAVFERTFSEYPSLEIDLYTAYIYV